MGNSTRADGEAPLINEEGLDRLIKKAMRSLGWLAPMTEEAVRLADEELRARAGSEYEVWPTVLRESPARSPARGQATATLSVAAPRASSSAPGRSFAFMPFEVVGGGSETCIVLDPSDRVAERFGAAGVGVVRPYSTSRLFTGLKDVLRAGQWMGVDYVFDGTIHCAGSHLRAAARLVRVSDGASVWATTWAGDRGGLIAFEDSLAEQVMLVFEPHPTSEQKARFVGRLTDNTDAYVQYKLGRDRFNSFDEEGLGDAIDYFKRAFAIDPDFAAAYACAAETLIWLILLGLHSEGRGPAELLDEARRCTAQALALNPSQASALACEGFIKMLSSSDWQGAARSFRRALAEDSNYVLGHLGLACVLMSGSRFEQALAHAEAALNIDPNSFICQFLKGTIFYESRDFVRAARQFEETLLLHKRLAAQFRGRSEALPPSDTIFYGLALAYTALGRHQDAALAAKKAARYARNNPIKLALRGYVLAAGGRHEEAETILEQLVRAGQGNYIPFHIALVHAVLGVEGGAAGARHKEAALHYLHSARGKCDYWMSLLHLDPRLDGLRSEPGFKALLRDTNLPPPGIL